MIFDFDTDKESQIFCESIAREMVRVFNISLDEAIGRISREWMKKPIIGDDVIYHETENYWAKNIYFGKSSEWWLSPPNLRPKPYP